MSIWPSRSAPGPISVRSRPGWVRQAGRRSPGGISPAALSPCTGPSVPEPGPSVPEPVLTMPESAPTVPRSGHAERAEPAERAGRTPGDEPHPDYPALLERIAADIAPVVGLGRQASYIPALASVGLRH